ncbi:MAG: TraR/DksA C4-type zinc finger protein [Verrucomicrobiales bacterium]
MTPETPCRYCGAIIPAERLAALPSTLLCVRCAQEQGPEDEIEVTMSSSGKAGSLKKTGEDISVRVKEKPFVDPR